MNSQGPRRSTEFMGPLSSGMSGLSSASCTDSTSPTHPMPSGQQLRDGSWDAPCSCTPSTHLNLVLSPLPSAYLLNSSPSGGSSSAAPPGWSRSSYWRHPLGLPCGAGHTVPGVEQGVSPAWNLCPSLPAERVGLPHGSILTMAVLGTSGGQIHVLTLISQGRQLRHRLRFSVRCCRRHRGRAV